jgi:hypothetical protein
VAKKVSFKREKVSGPPDGSSWVWHTLDLLTSDAWVGRSFAVCRFIEFLEVEHLRNAGLENGNLKAPYDQLEKVGIWRRDIAKAIQDAVRRGLVEITGGGRDFPTGKRAPTLYRLTFFSWKEDGVWQAPTDDWKRYQVAKPPLGENQKPSGETATRSGVKPPLGQKSHTQKLAEIQPSGETATRPNPSGETATAIYILGDTAARCAACGGCEEGRGGAVDCPSWTVDRRAWLAADAAA